MVDEGFAMRECDRPNSSRDVMFAVVFADSNLFWPHFFLFYMHFTKFKIPRSRALAWCLASWKTKKGL